jgi:uncharacterized membrane protein
MTRAARRAVVSGRRKAPLEPALSSGYDVGYCRPPKHAQFKPGQSGNPQGRPKRRKSFRQMLRDVLNEKVNVREGEREYKTPAIIALARTTLRHGLRGDAKFVSAVIALMRLFGLSETETEDTLNVSLSAEDEAIIADFLRRTSVPIRRGPIRKRAKSNSKAL